MAVAIHCFRNKSGLPLRLTAYAAQHIACFFQASDQLTMDTKNEAVTYAASSVPG